MNSTFDISPSKIKRTFDILAAVLALVILSPLILVIAIAIKVTSTGSVIFRQERCGIGSRPFTMYKFRTMVKGAERMGLGYEVAKDDDRITKVGSFLRNASLDEIPQLINVIRGDMSLLGPRPMIADQVARLEPRQLLRQQVRPGVSGWAQVNGRNSLSWNEKIELDVWYIENWSFLLDLKIIWRTFFTVFSRDGLYGVDGVNKTLR
jgi:lipopolysaccharide/colanic/teichoic acid biosynthesis glycosyltransferase